MVNDRGIKMRKEAFVKAAYIIQGADRQNQKELLQALNSASALLRMVDSRLNGDEDIQQVIEKIRQIKLKVVLGMRC